jgi:hypothetical protein
MKHIGDVRDTSIDPEIYAAQLEANRAEPCAYKGRDDLNVHVPQWTRPLITEGDSYRFGDWVSRCKEHGYTILDVVDVATGLRIRANIATPWG